jgi:hypothetical protein
VIGSLGTRKRRACVPSATQRPGIPSRCVAGSFACYGRDSVPSVDSVVARLEEARFAISVRPAESEWGRRAVAVDGDGHRVELISAAR